MIKKQNSADTLTKFYGASFYREDVQGLRALGALLIMIFHIWFNKVSGGVDVFIVVSGFLMTGLLLRGWLESGARSTAAFWSKVIVRIAPSANIVLFVTLIVGYYVLPPSSIPAFIFEAIAATFHLENVVLMHQSVDYLAADTSPSPIQHFWALSVQVQFYALLPFLLIPLAVLSHKKQSPVPILIGFMALLLMSFVYASYKVSLDPVSTYFNTFARGWEFLAGGMVFLLSPWIRLNKKTASILALLGVTLVLCSAFLIPRGAAYPGPIDLVPVLAAVLMIVSGMSQGYQNKALSSKVMVFLGGMSFTIYLWHWPVLIFYREVFNTQDVALAPGLLIMLVNIPFITQSSRRVIMPHFGTQMVSCH